MDEEKTAKKPDLVLTQEEITESAESTENTENVAKKSGGTKKSGIVVFILGLVVFVAGVGLLVMSLVRQPKVQDAEYLVSVREWVREGEPSVVWKFTEIGAGTLTTNAHVNDYDFIWAMEGDTLKIETRWLYDLDDEFEYKIKDGKLVLDDKIVFIPAE